MNLLSLEEFGPETDSWESHGVSYQPGLLSDVVGRRFQDILTKIPEKWLKSLGRTTSGYVPSLQELEEVRRLLFSVESIHSLCHDRSLIAWGQQLLQSEPLVHPKPFVRLIPPSSEGKDATPAHQDFVSQQGSVDTITFWIALHDFEENEGGLAVVPNSHRDGVRPITLGDVPGSMQVANSATENWHSTRFRAGDVVAFHSLTVHMGLPNLSCNYRISLDVRMQRWTDPIDQHALVHYGDPNGWQGLYSHWSGEAPQHFWEGRPLTFSQFDRRYLDQRDELGFAAAEAGDPRGLAELQRMIRQYPSGPSRERAEKLYTQLMNGE